MSPPKALSSPIPQTVAQPLNTIHVGDLKKGTAQFDAWLMKETNGYVNLSRMMTAAAVFPVTGNLIAAVDTISDVIGLYDTYTGPSSQRPDTLTEMFDWASLGINLIGIVPIPGTGPARMSLRGSLFLVRGKVLKMGRSELKAGVKSLGPVLAGLLMSHMSESLAGEVDQLAKRIKSELKTIIAQCKDKVAKIINGIINALKNLQAGSVFDAEASKREAVKRLQSAQKNLTVDPTKSIVDFFAGLMAVQAYGEKSAANAMAGTVSKLVPASVFNNLIGKLEGLIPLVHQKLDSLVLPDTGTVMWLIDLLIKAVSLKMVKGKMTSVHEGRRNQRKNKRGEGRIDASKHGKKPQKPAGGCKNCPAPARSSKSIGYALGEESFSHTDFTLPGVIPLDWTRTYCSNFTGNEEGGPLGPRWTTPFSARFDLMPDAQTLQYHDASGRSLTYPLLQVGQMKEDLIEGMSIVRISDDLISVTRGQEMLELYERHGERFELGMIRDRNGQGFGLSYTDGLLVSISSSAGATVGFKHDALGRITEAFELDEGKPARALARYGYDDAGDLIEATDENGASWKYTYANHLITRYTDRTGRGMNVEWNGTGADAKAIHEWADDGTFETRLRWDDHQRLTYVTDALGNETRFHYDGLGYTTRIEYPDNTEEWFFRDEAKNVVKHAHPEGEVEYFEYDDRDNLTMRTGKDDRTTYFVYDTHDNLTGIQDPEDHRWQRYYDSNGRVTEAVDPLGRVTKYRYNKAGLPIAITDPKDGEKQIEWRSDGQLASYTDCSGKTTRWTYDPRGRLIAMQNPVGETTQYEYEAGHLGAVVQPDKTRETFERDAEGRLLAHTDALERRTHYRYTAAGLISKRINPLGDELTYVWDAAGRLTELCNENASRHSFAHDSMGRLTAETGFDQKIRRYFHDASSGVLQNVLDGDVMQAVEFDAMGRLTRQRSWPAQFTDRGHVFLEPQGDQVKPDESLFAYDGLGRLQHADNDVSKLQWFYDPAGNLVREHQHYRIGRHARSFVWQHEYNELDVRVATARPDGHRLEWLTYGSGHVHGVLLDAQSVADFERDDAHREVSRQLGNQLKQTTAYDAAGRLARQVLQGGAHKVMERKYRYDAAGQLEQIDDAHRGALRYAYDPLGRLTRAQTALGEETFRFDPASNLTQADRRDDLSEASTSSRRAALLDNLLKDYAGTHYAYDARGNLIERNCNGTKTVFEWNCQNQMTAAQSQGMQATYQYDALGRRFTKHTEAHVYVPSGAGSGYEEFERNRLTRELGLGHTLYGWDGDTLAYETSWEEQTTTHYVYEAGSFVPLMQATVQAALVGIETPVYAGDYERASDPMYGPVPAPVAFDTIAYYHCDQIGTPQELTDAAGELAWQARYRAWGEAKEVISEAARKAGIGNPIRFAGQYWDKETGLHYNRHRYYDPQTGRFISKDPIGLEGGFNEYAYAENPTGWIDPLGLKKRGPKTGGCGPHNEMIAAWGKEVLDAGGNIIAGGGGKERLVPTPGGSKGGRRPDIIYTDADGKIIYGNVGKVKADGVTPVPRETKATDDLRTKTTGKDVPDDVQFRAYNCCSCKRK